MEIKDILAVLGELTCVNVSLQQEIAKLKAEIELLKKKD